MTGKEGPGKGKFGGVDLPLADAYVQPSGRNRVVVVGLVLGLVVAAVFAVDSFMIDRKMLQNGPVIAGHSAFEAECSACHDPFGTVSEERCRSCHDRFGGAQPAHSYDAHYTYRSGDTSRAGRREGEEPCTSCHIEHQGRDSTATRVDDSRCLSCHDFGSFNRSHPEFAFARDATADQAGLLFAHSKHIERVLERTQESDPNGSCLSCHSGDRDGSLFAAIDFEEHCSSCHLGASHRKRSPNLPRRGGDPIILDVAGNGVDLNLGVEALDAIVARDGPGEQWARYENPTEFRSVGRRIMKTRLHHRDPWITHNLQELRRALFPSSDLEDLLISSSDLQRDGGTELHHEAIDTLETYARGLRGSPDPNVQLELDRIEGLLTDLRRQLSDGEAQLDPTQFQRTSNFDPRLSAEQIEEINDFASRMAEACVACHTMENAVIARVQKDQKVLRRANFDHRPHMIQRSCLDCHASIPTSEDADEVEADRVDASVLHIPTIENCRECHSNGKVSSSCSGCHVFHPKTSLPLRRLPVSEDGAGTKGN